MLLVRPSALGDVCRTVPLLASLRRAWPEAVIDWVVQEEFAPAIAAHPDLSNVVPFPRKRFARWWLHPRLTLELLGWMRELGRPGYDLAIDAQGLARSALITRASGARRRIGLQRARELAPLGYTDRVATTIGMHTVDEMLALLQPLAVEPVRDMRLHLDAGTKAWHEAWLREHDLDERRHAVLAPTARWASKRWPAERWRELLAPLRERGFERIIVIGAPGEREQVQPLLEAGPSTIDMPIDMVGKSTIAQTMAIIAGAALLIANDSAPLHMGQGFGITSLGLFGPTDPVIVGPYRIPKAALRAYAPKPGERVHFKDPKLGDALMRLIAVQDVLDRVDALLAKPARAREAESGAA